MPQTILCPKEVAAMLGTSERNARRLMAQQTIESFRIGEKPLRTTRGKIWQYVEGQFGRYRRAVTVTDIQAA